MLDVEIAPAEYTNIKNMLKAEIETLERKRMELVTDYGEPQRAVWHYENGDLDTKQKTIGSMFPITHF